MYSPAIDALSSSDKVTACPAGEPPFAIARLQFDIIRKPDTIEGEWRDLSALPRNSLHQSFDWCHAWWNSHGRAPLVVRGRLDGRTVMILPLDVTSTGGFRQIGRASCRESVCQYVSSSVVGVSLRKKSEHRTYHTTTATITVRNTN